MFANIKALMYHLFKSRTNFDVIPGPSENQDMTGGKKEFLVRITLPSGDVSVKDLKTTICDAITTRLNTAFPSVQTVEVVSYYRTK